MKKVLGLVVLMGSLAGAGDLYVPGSYATIQSAAKIGDTIIAWAGTYNEAVYINKGISLVGISTPTITASGPGGVNTVTFVGHTTDYFESQPKYAPNEVIVKFKENIPPEFVLKNLGFKVKSFQRIHSIQPAIARFKKEIKLEKSSDGWYWFLGKNYQEVNNIPDEELFKQAQENIPEQEKALYQAYKLGLPEGMDVQQAIALFQRSAYIQYAEPNYIRKANFIPDDPYYHRSGTWGQTLIGDRAGTWTVSGGVGSLTSSFGTNTIFYATGIGRGTLTATDGTNTATITLIVGNLIGTNSSYLGTLTTSWGSATIRTGTNTESLIILPPEPAQVGLLQGLSGNIGVGIVVNAYGTSGERFSGTFTYPIHIEIHYNEPQNIDENTLKLYISSDNGTGWQPIPYSLNTVQNIIFGTFSHLSIIAPAGGGKQKALPDLINVIAYPNPCKGGNKINFANLTDQCWIRIYSIVGELIFEQEFTNTGGKADWYLKNRAGEKVASGIYIYVITNNQNQKATGKIGVIR